MTEPNPESFEERVKRAQQDKTKQNTQQQVIKATPFVWIDASKIPMRDWLYKPHYIRKFASLMLSSGGLGKSSTLIVEALAMVTGRDLLNVQPDELLRVWYWNGEDPMEELQRRFAAAAKHFNITQEDIGDRLNENDNTAIDQVAKAWSDIADKANCSVMLAHHTRKKVGGSNGMEVEDGRGASSLRDAVRTARTLNTMTEKEAEVAKITPKQRRYYFRANIGKENLTPPADDAEWFKLVSVDMGNNPVMGYRANRLASSRRGNIRKRQDRQ